MTDYAEMAKLAKRIEFLESREQINGAKSWLKLEERLTEEIAVRQAVEHHFLDFRSGVNRDLDEAIERITAIETRMQICPADIAEVWNPCANCNGATCSNGKEFPGLRKQVENNWTGDKNPACHSDEAETGDSSLSCGKCLQALQTGRLHVLCPYLHEWRRPSDTCNPDLLDTLSRLGRDEELRGKHG